MNTNDNLFKSAGDVYNKLRTIDSCSFNYTNCSIDERHAIDDIMSYVLKYATAYLHNKVASSSVEDLAQICTTSVFKSLSKHKYSFDSPGKFISFIKHICKKRLYDYYNYNNRVNNKTSKIRAIESLEGHQNTGHDTESPDNVDKLLLDTEELIYCLKAIFCTGNDITIQLAYANAFCNRFNNNTMMFNMETLKRQDSLLKAISYTLHNINDTFNTDLSLKALIYIINTPLNYDVAWEISLENLPPKLSRLKHKVKESFHSLYM